MNALRDELAATDPRYDQDVVAVIDTERQRLATLYDESASRPVRESLARRVAWLTRVMDRYIARSIAAYEGGFR